MHSVDFSAQMALRGPQINHMPSKSHFIPLFKHAVSIHAEFAEFTIIKNDKNTNYTKGAFVCDNLE